ncbi:methyl-accepting chemotaxis protein [Aureimonas sp. SK2]|uniref:methyl-accepting chemotaxis protein n=1 Tax=Aureimonas sp. SK2 TaxID=3015992 RepID=UPI002444488B|nr:methyl-accepting chemotaxis protein [Aureimonas sp. SK2]
MSFKNIRVNRKLAIAFAPILAAVTVMTGVVLNNISDIQTAAGWDQHTTKVLAEAQKARQGILEQVAGMRGYIIAGQDSYLKDYENGRSLFESAASEIAALTSDNPQQQERVARLKTAGADYVAKVADPQRRLAANPATRDQAAAITVAGTASTYASAVKSIIGEITGAEEALLTKRRADTENSFASAYWTLGLGACVAFLVAGSMGWLLSRSVARPMLAMTAAMKRLAGGDNAVAVPAMGQRDELGDMAGALESFRQAAIEKERLEGMTASERQAAEKARLAAEQRAAAAARDAFVAAVRPSFERLSAGDLTARIDPEANADYVEVCELFNASVGQLESTIGSVVGAVASMRSGLSEITVAAGDLSQRTEQQAASLEETVAALGEVARGVGETARSADSARAAASQAQREAEKGGQVVSQAMAAMAEIERSSQRIGNIIGVIDEIAFQTNLLALNAGVEAARAGEAGRGFAVVAQEVRGLAQRSAEAAKEIKDLIATSSTQVSDGVDLVSASGRSLEQIVDQVGGVAQVISQMAQSAREQAISLKEVSTAADGMDKVTQQNAAMVEETTAAAQSLSAETENLGQLVGRFRTRSAGSAVPAATRSVRIAAKAAAPGAAVQMRTLGRGGAAPAPSADSWEEF